VVDRNKTVYFYFFGIAVLCLKKLSSEIGKPVGQNKAFYVVLNVKKN
jgi:hypothetical protein